MTRITNRAAWLVVGLLSLSGSVALADGVQPDTLTPFPSNNPPPTGAPLVGGESSLAGTEAGPGFKGGTFGVEIGIGSFGGPSIGAVMFVGASGAIHVELAMTAIFAPTPVRDGLTVTIEGGFRKYLLHYERLHLYVEPGIVLGNPSQKFYMALLGSIGVQVFIFDRFAVGGHTGLAFEFRDLGPGIGASAMATTGTSQLFAAYYF